MTDYKANPWFTTFTGRKVFVYDPNPDDILIEDIGHALAHICRFNGHCRRFYSVAEHSIMCCLNGPVELRRELLMHDGAEAYVGDMISPMKYAVGGPYKLIEGRWEHAIAQKFGLRQGAEVRAQVKDVDLRMLATEHRDLVPDGQNWPMLEGYRPYLSPVAAMAPAKAKAEFLDMAGDLL